jgi:endonuclease YncB( thermonuclease family)
MMSKTTNRFSPEVSADDFSCQVQSVTDGDTFGCTHGKKIRINGIDAPERSV